MGREAKPGSRRVMSSSRLKRPSSTHWRTAIAVSSLVQEASAIMVSGSRGLLVISARTDCTPLDVV
jgi:hypothetical protein